MFAKRIIPCLDVNRGRVVKGTNFLNLRDAGDPVEVAARYEQEGADELVFLDITASHEERDIMLDVVRRTAEVVLHARDRRRGHPHARRHPRPAQRRGRQGVDQLGRRAATPTSSRQAARRFGSQCIVVNIDPKRVQKRRPRSSGKSTSTADASAPDWRRWPGPARSSGWGPARSC